MNKPALQQAQQGATLFIALIMLLLITITVVTTFNLSSINLKLVGNMQMRDEAIAASNSAIELVIGTPFTDNPAAAAQTINVDIDNNDVVDYVVDIAQPVCVRAAVASTGATTGFATLGGGGGGLTGGKFWNTTWEIVAATTDPKSGASVEVRQGIRILLDPTDKATVCP